MNSSTIVLRKANPSEAIIKAKYQQINTGWTNRLAIQTLSSDAMEEDLFIL